MSEHSLHVCLLGGFQLLDNGGPAPLPRQAQRLLALLALRTAGTRSTLAGTLWEDVRESRAQSNLRNAVWRIGLVSRTALLCSRQAIELSPQLSVDLRDSRRQAAALDSGEPPERIDDLIGVLDRDVLPTWDEPWVVLERERQRQLRLHALETLSGALSARGRYPDAIAAALAAVGAEPLRESAQRALIAAHLGEGNVSEAIRQFESYRRLLDAELAVAPGEQLRLMLQQALAAR
jgi:DNA-binding SARP family transcriptional activator